MAAERWAPFLASKPLPATAKALGEPTIGSRGYTLMDYLKQRAERPQRWNRGKQVSMVTGVDAAQMCDGAFDQESEELYTQAQRRVRSEAEKAEKIAKAEQGEESGEGRGRQEESAQIQPDGGMRRSPASTPQSLWDQELLEALDLRRRRTRKRQRRRRLRGPSLEMAVIP